jgi:hypothetical protein
MHYFKTIYRTTLFISYFVLAGCALVEEKVSNPDKSKIGVLVLAGVGLNPIYSDVKDSKASSFWFVTSQKIAESLHSEITKNGTEAQMFINTNPSVEMTTYLVQLLTEKKRDGLIQVAIHHIKNDSENAIYLELIHNTLKFQKTEKGEQVVFGQGLTEKHKLIGDPLLDKWNMGTPVSQYAIDFANKLSKAGYIGSD